MRKLSAKWVPKCLNADKKRQRCQSSGQLLEFFSARSKWFPVGRDWWPWTKPGYITMTRRQSINQWNSSITAHPAPKNSECKNPLEKFSPRILQTINAEYYSSLLVQMKDILKEKCRRKVTKSDLFLHDNAPAHRALATQKKLAYLDFQGLESPTLFSGSGPVGLPPVPWAEKTTERSPFFVRHGGHCCRGDLVGQTSEFFFFEWLAKVRATG